MGINDISTYDVTQIAVTVNGVEITNYVSFIYKGDQSPASLIKGSTGVVGYEYGVAEPTWTLKVLDTEPTMADIYALWENQTTFSVVATFPTKTITCTNCRIATIEAGEAADKTPQVTINGLAMQIQMQPMNSGA
jgi:hypothetical protein